MPTKIERFAQWRGNKAQEEKIYIDSALLVSDYVSSIKQLDTIKTDLSSVQSSKYIALNQEGQLGFGVLLYCKLQIEEALDLMPSAGVIERQALTDLKNLCSEIYDDARRNIDKKINDCIAQAKKLLEQNPALFMDKKQAKSLFFDLYTLLNIVNLSLNNLNLLQRIAASALVNLDQIKKEIASLLHKTEVKVKQLDKLLVELPKTNNPLFTKKTIQDHFNNSVLAVLKTDVHEDHQIILLEKIMNEGIKGINRLISKRSKKIEITSILQKIQELLNSVEENDNKIRGRKYFLDLIGSNLESFNALMNNLNGYKKIQLTDKIIQLKTPNLYQKLSSKVLYGMSWATTLVTVTYRYVAPQTMQEVISAQMPLTIDGECKAQLKDLARDCLFSLNQQLMVTDREIDKLTHQLSNGDIELKQLIINESSDNLIFLAKANSVAKEAIIEYRRISKMLNHTVLCLKVIKESNSALTLFIQAHDGFLVMLSNLFAKISLIFKSDTAAMIDSAREMNDQLAIFELEYNNKLSRGLNAIEHNPDINKEIKNKLQQKIELDMTKETEVVLDSCPSKEEVRYLTNNLKKLFNMKSVIGSTEENGNFSISPGNNIIPNTVRDLQM